MTIVEKTKIANKLRKFLSDEIAIVSEGNAVKGAQMRQSLDALSDNSLLTLAEIIKKS